jgi:hypothetical protein
MVTLHAHCMRESVCRVPGRGGKVGIRSTARNPSVQAAIGIASAMMAGQAAAQDALPTIDVRAADAVRRRARLPLRHR